MVNLTSFDNLTNVLDLVTQLNVLSDGFLVALMTITLFMVAFVSFSANRQGAKVGLIAASFITAVSSLFLAGAGLLADDKLLYVSLVLAGFGIFLSVFKKE